MVQSQNSIPVIQNDTIPEFNTCYTKWRNPRLQYLLTCKMAQIPEFNKCNNNNMRFALTSASTSTN